MKKIIRLTEGELHKIINEVVTKIIKEDFGGTSSFSVNSTGNALGSSDPTGQAKNHIDVPAFGGKNKKKVGGDAFSEPIMRQKHNLGDVTDAKANQVDMKPALDRTPGFSMGERKK